MYSYFDIRNGKDTNIPFVFPFDPIVVNTLENADGVTFAELKLTERRKQKIQNQNPKRTLNLYAQNNITFTRRRPNAMDVV